MNSVEYYIGGGGLLGLLGAVYKFIISPLNNHHARIKVLEQIADENKENHAQMDKKIDKLFDKIDDVNKYLRNGR